MTDAHISPLVREAEELIAARADFEGAIELLREALDQNPSDSAAHNNLSIIYWHQQKPERAIRHAKKAVEIDGENEIFVKNYCTILLGSGMTVQAKYLLKRFLVNHSDDEETIQLLEQIEKSEQQQSVIRTKSVSLKRDRSSYLAMKQRIEEAKHSAGVSGEKEGAESDSFYVKKFTEDREWSNPHPNGDENSRWEKIRSYLDLIKVLTNGRPLRILDLGCGRGWLANMASSYGRCEGIDPVHGVIEHARTLFPHITFYSGELSTLLSRNDFQPYDVVISSEVIEHVPDQHKDTFMQEITSALTPEGFLILSTPRGDVLEEWTRYAGSPDQPIEDWIDEETVRVLMRRNGLTTLGLEHVAAHPPQAPSPIDVYQVWLSQKKYDAVPRLTLGIPTRNRIESLKRLLESVQDQSFQDFEVIIADDGNIPLLGETLMREYSSLPIRYVKGKQVNLPVNRQTILDHAVTELVVMCDDDHVLDINCLWELYKAAVTEQNVGIVSAIWPFPESEVVRFDDVRHLEEFALTFSNLTAESDYWFKNGWKTFCVYHDDPRLMESEFSGGGCVLFSKQAVVKAGGFPAYYSVVSFREDTDISHRVWLTGSRVIVNPKALAYHLPEERGGCRDNENVEQLRKNDGELFLQKLSQWRQGIREGKSFDTLFHQKKVKIAANDHSDDATKISEGSDFDRSIRDLFRKIRPAKIVETGTYLGTGTTNIIAGTLRDLKIDRPKFYSIEINPLHYGQAKENLWKAGLFPFVTLLHGLSVPRHKLPTVEQIQRDTVEDIEFDGIFVDHTERERALRYYQETNFDTPNEDLLGYALKDFDFAPDFVLLDSGGHMGFVEFLHLLSLLKKECYIGLDDVYHIKHHKSLRYIQSHPEFEVIVSSKEKFGFCIAKYTPPVVSKKIPARRIVFVRTDAIGDNILAASMIQPIKEAYPGSELFVVCQDSVAELYNVSPFVDKVIPFNKKKAYDNQEYLLQLEKELASVKADLVLNSVYSKEPITDHLVACCGAPSAVGMNGDGVNATKQQEGIYARYYSRMVNSGKIHKGEMERHVDFLDEIGIPHGPLRPSIWLSPDDEAFAERIFVETGFEPHKTIALFAGAQAAVRYYNGYGKALRDVCRERGYSVIALGGPADAELNKLNLKDLTVPYLDLSGKTSIRQAAAVIRRCILAVGAETGLAHAANAVGTKNVVLLGGGHFGRFMPYSALTSAACLPLECFYCNWHCSFEKSHCVGDLHPDVLSRAIEETVDRDAAKPRIYHQSASSWKRFVGEPHSGVEFRQYCTIDAEFHEVSVAADEKYRTMNKRYRVTNGKEIDVSVILPTKNRPEGMRAVLETLPAAMFTLSYEVLLYVGGDYTDEMKKIVKQHPSVRVFFDKDVFRSGEKFNWSKLMNHGFGHSRGRWITYSSDDIEYHPLAFLMAMDRYDTDKKVGGVSFLSCNTMNDPTKQKNLYGYDTFNGIVYANFGLIRASVFAKTRRFNEQYRFYGADCDLCFQVQQLGYEFPISASSLVDHHDKDDEIRLRNAFEAYAHDLKQLIGQWKEQSLFAAAKGNLRQIRQYIPQEEMAVIRKKLNDVYDTMFETHGKIPPVRIAHAVKPSVGYAVSAIVSTYQSEKFLRGCLDDLLAQTMYRRNELEIIVVNGGSPQKESAIVREYQSRYPHIVLIESAERIPIYTAWNKGIHAAKGRYITNANTDDRHAPDAFDTMVEIFSANPSVDLVYADCYATETMNDSFGSLTVKKRIKWPDFHPDLLLFSCFIGPQPMWKKELHQKFGYFDERLRVAGDYEFWLRISRSAAFFHCKQPLGLYYFSPESAEHRDSSLTAEETTAVQRVYWQQYVSSPDHLRLLQQSLEEQIRYGLIKNGDQVQRLLRERESELLNGQKKQMIRLKVVEVLKRAHVLSQSKRWNEAASALEQLIQPCAELDDADVSEEIFTFLGTCYLASNELEQAKESFENALRINERSSQACAGLGEVFYLAEMDKEAKTMFEWALRHDPEDKKASTRLREINMNLGFALDHTSLEQSQEIING